MRKIKVLIATVAITIAGATFAAGQIVPETKHVTHKVYHKTKRGTKWTYHKTKRGTKWTYRKGKHIGRKVGTKTRHVVVGHHHRKP